VRASEPTPRARDQRDARGQRGLLT
jgi:hypothetical protein